MIFQKTNPVGVDWYIDKLQTAIHNGLLEKWSGNPDKFFECYGRCYRNKNDNGYIAEVLKSGNEYQEVYWNDSLAAISFFGIGSNIGFDKGYSTADVHLVFFVNLAKIRPELAGRGDAEVRNDVYEILGPNKFDFEYVSTDLWLENVLREYPGSRRDQRLKTVDMQPVHCFRINMKLIFNSNKNC